MADVIAQPRATAYTSISVTPDAADALRQMTAHLTGAVGRRITQSTALLIAARVVTAHLTDEAVAATAADALIRLTEQTTGGTR